MKCNYKRIKNKSILRCAIRTEEGPVKEISISENEYIKAIFEHYDIEIVTQKEKLINALKQGDYVIGIDYNPLLLQNVFHYENKIFKFLKFADVGDHNFAPLRLKRVTSILLGTPSYSLFEALVESMPHYDEFIVYRKGDLLDIENIPPSISSLIK